MTDADIFIVLIIVVLGFLQGGEDMKKVKRGEKKGAKQSKSLLDYIMLKDLMDK